MSRPETPEDTFSLRQSPQAGPRRQVILRRGSQDVPVWCTPTDHGLAVVIDGDRVGLAESDPTTDQKMRSFLKELVAVSIFSREELIKRLNLDTPGE